MEHRGKHHPIFNPPLLFLHPKKFRDMLLLMSSMNLVLTGALMVWAGGVIYLIRHYRELSEPKRPDSQHGGHP